MVVRCAIGTCGNTKKKNRNLSFHQFPIDYYWRAEWKNIINVNGGVHSNTTLVFSLRKIVIDHCVCAASTSHRIPTRTAAIDD